jgi:hypothetical protein
MLKLRKLRRKIIASFLFLFLALTNFVSADTFGQSQTFYVSPQYDFRSRTQVSATLRSISNRAYFYVEDGYWDSIGSASRNQLLSWITSLSQEFDNRIYPLETQLFGSEPNPGVDNDSRITILLTTLIENAGGYFDTANGYKKEQVSNSNEREMIYLNADSLADLRRASTFLAHEFQHLISFNQKEKLRNISDEVWLNELRSQYAVTLLGYNDNFSGSDLEKRLEAFLGNPSDSLTEWKNLPSDYGQVSLFAEYLAEHWSPQVIADTLRTSAISIPSLNESFRRNGFSDSFIDIFGQWMAANILNDISVNKKFGYNREGLKKFHVAPTKAFTNLDDNTVFAVSDFIKDWQAKWYEISSFPTGRKNFLKVDFSSPSLASFKIFYLILKNNGGYLFSAFNPTPRSSALYLSDLASINKIIFMPVKTDKISGFYSEEPSLLLSLSFQRMETLPQGFQISREFQTDNRQFSEISSFLDETVPASRSENVSFPLPGIPDGSLIRAENDYKVYVVNGRWRRHIISPKIFSFYPHLGFDKVKVVSPSILAQYQESNLIRYQFGEKVYSVNESGIKHWLHITAEQFLASGRSWDSIFIVNSPELNFYKQGAEIRK